MQESQLEKKENATSSANKWLKERIRAHGETAACVPSLGVWRAEMTFFAPGSNAALDRCRWQKINEGCCNGGDLSVKKTPGRH